MSNSGSRSMLNAGRQWLLIALCVSGAVVVSSAAFADDRRGRGHEFRGEQHSRVRDRGRDDWRDEGHHRRHERRHERRHDRRHDQRSDRHHRSRYHGRDWHFFNGRYWAPPQYRGRYCADRRHFHGGHFHVAARDYDDYYYPRYRYYGSRPLGADASVIITLPLF